MANYGFDLIDVDEEVAEAEVAEMVIHRNPKVYLERLNLLEVLDEENFRIRYRMRKATAERIIQMIEGQIAPFINNRGSPISATVQFLATVRYLAKGAYGVDIADQHGLSQPSLSNIIKRVSQALAAHRHRFINFPTAEESHQVKADFYRFANCPSVIGAIDGTHVKIKCPGGDYPLLYLNRKGYYSLNVQVVCDAKCKIRDIVARWRGSTHDSRIWNECHLRRRFMHGEIDGVLVGDNGYQCSRYILTPLLNPQTNAEQRYNTAHIRTRNVIERTFGIWKNRFRCFFNGLNLQLETTKAVIVATAILHNLIIQERLDNDDSSDDEYDDDNDRVIYHNDGREHVQGNLFRARYIDTHFNEILYKMCQKCL
ncbi:putative nuclease HARBI1 [Photinus pyralis]|nr:putative nuclease HARBI1 [Photinus pyralis]